MGHSASPLRLWASSLAMTSRQSTYRRVSEGALTLGVAETRLAETWRLDPPAELSEPLEKSNPLRSPSSALTLSDSQKGETAASPETIFGSSELVLSPRPTEPPPPTEPFVTREEWVDLKTASQPLIKCHMQCEKKSHLKKESVLNLINEKSAFNYWACMRSISYHSHGCIYTTC